MKVYHICETYSKPKYKGDDPTMSNVPGGPSPWGRSTLHLRSLLLQAFALSSTFAARLLCLWWEKGEHWDELIGNLITSEIKAEAVQHLELGVEERSPGSFHPPTNAGSLVIEDCERWNGLLTDDYNSSAVINLAIDYYYRPWEWFLHFQGWVAQQTIELFGSAAKPHSP